MPNSIPLSLPSSAYSSLRPSRSRLQLYPFSNIDSNKNMDNNHLNNHSNNTSTINFNNINDNSTNSLNFKPISPSTNCHPIKGRLAPSSIIITFIAFACFAFAIFFATNIEKLATPTRTTLYSSSNLTLLPQRQPKQQTSTPLLPPPSQQQQQHEKHEQQLNPPVSATVINPNAHDTAYTEVDLEKNRNHPYEQRPQQVKGSSITDNGDSGKAMVKLDSGDNGRVGWNRSWPISKEHDDTGLFELQNELKLTNNTLLNYFHLHKTGGVSMKASLLELVNRIENRKQLTKRGSAIEEIETCYESSSLSSLSIKWRCDFGKIREMGESKLKKYDIILGHQYWEKGSDYYFGKDRTIKYFTIVRHPLARKLSFYYHFYVRNLGLNESLIPRSDVMKFVLNSNDIIKDARMRDAGPNYYASRFLSDGMSYFEENQILFKSEKEENEVIEKINGYIDDRFVFMGLQTQNYASTCMLEKTMQVFAHVHGIDTYVGTSMISRSNEYLKNTGDYNWTAKKLWASMTKEEKKKFNEIERVDIAIYNKALERFKKDVKLFQCEHKINVDGRAEEHFN